MAQVMPAILSADVNEAQDKLNRVMGLAEIVQIDVADGKFTGQEVFFDPDYITKLNGSVDFDMHLMISEPEKNILRWVKDPRIKRVTFHIEASKDPGELISLIHRKGFDAGLANNPETDPENLKSYVGKADMVLCLGVHPGRGGQPFAKDVLGKIRKLKDMGFIVGVDGGVNQDTALGIVDAGADILVVGNFLFKNEDLKEAFDWLKSL